MCSQGNSLIPFATTDIHSRTDWKNDRFLSQSCSMTAAAVFAFLSEGTAFGFLGLTSRDELSVFTRKLIGICWAALAWTNSSITLKPTIETSDPVSQSTDVLTPRKHCTKHLRPTKLAVFSCLVDHGPSGKQAHGKFSMMSEVISIFFDVTLVCFQQPAAQCSLLLHL